jgi:hypothetical protein
MPQYYKDAFAKEHTRIMGEGLGEFDDHLTISTETLDFDVLFIPKSEFLDRDDRDLDLYYRLLKTDTVVNLEFFGGTLRPENLREDMRTLREIYEANRAETIALHESIAQVQLELHRAKVQLSHNEAETVIKFLTRKFGSEVVTAAVTERLGKLSSEQLDDLLFEAASWQSGSEIESYLDRGSV